METKTLTSHELSNLQNFLKNDSLKSSCQFFPIILIAKTFLTETGREIFGQIKIDTDNSFVNQLAEFSSKLTYLSFTDLKKDSSDYNNKILNKYGHYSVVSSYRISFFCCNLEENFLLEFKI